LGISHGNGSMLASGIRACARSQLP
jgi:hypothetical protein